jgi:hypothetical protein
MMMQRRPFAARDGDVSWLRREEWPWWQAGLLLGLLSMFVFYTANYYLSASTTFSRAAGMIVGTVAPEHVANNAIYSEVYPYIAGNLLTLGAFGKLTLPSLLGVNHWIVIVSVAIVVAAALRWVGRKTA